VKAYISDITLPEERAGVLGRFNAVGSVGFIIAPVIGGTVAMHENGYLKVALMTCSVYLIGLAFIWFVFDNKKIKKTEEVKSSNNTEDIEIIDKSMAYSPSGSSVTRRKNLDTKTDDLADEKEDSSGSTLSKFFSFLRIDSVQHILDVLLIRFVMSLSMLIYRNNYTSMLDYRYGIDAKTTGYIISYGSIAGAISGMLVGTIYSYVKSDAKMMLCASLLMTSSLFGITVSPNIYTVLLCMTPLSLSTAIMRVNSHNLMLKRIKPEEKGAVMGVGDSMTSIARMLSPAIAGFAQEVSVTGACWLATGCAVTGVGLMITFQKYRQAKEAGKKTN
jgi:predicted MFS family arabinose efflux permease